MLPDDIGGYDMNTTMGLVTICGVPAKQSGISRKELARRLDVSASPISLIEGGKSQPSVGTLWAIVNELGLSLDQVFGNAKWAMEGDAALGAIGGPMVRPNDREVINLPTGVRWELLTHNQEKDVDFVYAVYEVGGASTPDGSLMPHRRREYGYVISGSSASIWPPSNPSCVGEARSFMTRHSPTVSSTRGPCRSTPYGS
jgi:transcriptional regulator with XRE-family HTH domain